ncbi:glycerophosphodiester phosphodiesterase family protein [Prevotella sp. 10(H)]|uniref:glycerophosphodiester phosphodiesterase family protein n=1 Tax=Prevotella sp. 10(H) TaxID=1158294 RepID=UPI0004A6F6D8|nr:glycerophosphodiester phosphodiesterase family protein [Prevotella sp. 10(H)]
MKKLFFLLLTLLVTSVMFSQSGKELLTLDNYLIPKNKKGAVIGKVIVPKGEKVSLVKDNSKLFTIDKQGNISLKKDAAINDSSPYRYEITLKTKDGEKSFELVKDDFIRNKVIAHRGAWKNHSASQNSLKALKKAIETGCEGSEFDVWLSSDNKVVLSHDPTIGGKTVEETTAAELFTIELKDGDHLPSLEEYIKCIKEQNKTRLVLEVKTSRMGKARSEAVADSCVQIVHRMKAQAWTDYITFSFDAAKRIRELDPTAKVLYLEADKSIEEVKEAKMSGIDYHYSNFLKDTELVNKAKAAGLLTNAWTVNKEEDMKTMLRQGLDYITTDEPELLMKIIANLK